MKNKGQITGVVLMGNTEFIGSCKCGSCGDQFFADLRFVTVAGNGTIKMAICEDCVTRYNPLRVKQGMSPMPYNPKAYNVDMSEVFPE